MKYIVFCAALFAVQANATPLPEYDTDTTCAEAAASSVENGMNNDDALAMAAFCKSMMNTAKQVASPMWESANDETRQKCAAHAEAVATDKGLPGGSYPALIDCMRDGREGKRDRLTREE